MEVPGRRGVEDKLQPGRAYLSNDSEDFYLIFISLFILQVKLVSQMFLKTTRITWKIGEVLHDNNFVALIDSSIKRIL